MGSTAIRLCALVVVLAIGCTGGEATAPEVVASVSITNPSTSLQYGLTVQLAGSVKSASGTALSGRTITWTTSNEVIARISSTGLVTAGAVRGGTAEPVTITASSEGKSATTTLRIEPIPVATVTPSLAQVTVYVGQTVQLGLTAKDVTGGIVTGRSVTWTSTSPNVATVSAQGLVTAVAPGAAAITGSIEGKTATTAMAVAVVPVSTVSISPATGRINVGQTLPLTASARDSAGNVVTGRAVTWSTSAPAVATVSTAGVVTAVAAGSATITATSEGRSGTALITVPPPAVPPSVERQVNATQTDNAITAVPATGEAPHLAITPSPAVAARGRLLVFLPGTQGRPTQYTNILRAGAARGFHAIGVNYMNQTAMGTLCQMSTNPECYWTARTEVIFGNGTPVSGQTAVTRANGLVNRVNKLLAWLHATYPAEGWGQYLLADNAVDWSKVILAGHSQGGGHVGVLAKSVLLSRAVYFSSPEDWNDLTDRPALWTGARPNVTPASRQYGLGADADPLVPNAHAFAHWDNLGLPKSATGPVLVDGGSPPFGNARQLRTALPFNPASTALTAALRNHGITVVDTSTPLDANGRSLFDTNGVWEYLCFQ
jgi:uncharacterized protein YjdB